MAPYKSAIFKKLIMNASLSPRLNLDIELPLRTREVSEQVALGYPKKAVAEIFAISFYTNFVRNACKKTGARNIVELSLWFRLKEDHVSLIVEDGKRYVGSLPRFQRIANIEASREMYKKVKKGKI